MSDLKRKAERLALELSRAGVAPGHLVGLSFPNSAAFVVSLLAAFKVEAVVTLISPKYGIEEWRAILSGMGQMAILAVEDVASHILEAAPAVDWRPLREDTGESRLSLGFSPGENRRMNLGDTALVKFSSGSTGIPKGIALTTENLMAEGENVARTLGVREGTRVLAPVPLSHSYGFDLGVLPMLFHGATLRTEEGFIPRKTLSALENSGIDIFLGVPTMYRVLLDIAPDVPPSLAHVGYLLSCTAPLTPETIGAFQTRYRAPICQHYGSSETGAATNHVPSKVMGRPASVGLPLSGVTLEIVGHDGKREPPGVEGEVVVRSKAVARRYVLGAPEGKDPFQDGAFHTGDLGVLDEEGFLEIRGRVDDIINVGGMKVSPIEVGRVLESLPAVREAIVYGVPDPLGGQVVEAIVTLRASTSEEEILKDCARRLADYKVPRRVHIRDDLPRGATGKARAPRGSG